MAVTRQAYYTIPYPELSQEAKAWLNAHGAQGSRDQKGIPRSSFDTQSVWVDSSGMPVQSNDPYFNEFLEKWRKGEIAKDSTTWESTYDEDYWNNQNSGTPGTTVASETNHNIFDAQDNYQMREGTLKGIDAEVRRGWGDQGRWDVTKWMLAGAAGATAGAYALPWLWGYAGDAIMTGLDLYGGYEGLLGENGLLTENGLRKTARLARNGDWEGAGWSLLGDVGNALMSIPGVSAGKKLFNTGVRVGDDSYKLGVKVLGAPEGVATVGIPVPAVSKVKPNLGYDTEAMGQRMKEFLGDPEFELKYPGLVDRLNTPEGKAVAEAMNKGEFTSTFSLNSPLEPSAYDVLQAHLLDYGSETLPRWSIGTRGLSPGNYPEATDFGNKVIDGVFLSNSPQAATAKYGFRDPLQTQLLMQDLLASRRVSEESYNWAKRINDALAENTYNSWFKKGSKTLKDYEKAIKAGEDGEDLLDGLSRVHFRPRTIQYGQSKISTPFYDATAPGQKMTHKMQYFEVDPSASSYQSVIDGMNQEEANLALNRWFSSLGVKAEETGAYNQHYLFDPKKLKLKLTSPGIFTPGQRFPIVIQGTDNTGKAIRTQVNAPAYKNFTEFQGNFGKFLQNDPSLRGVRGRKFNLDMRANDPYEMRTLTVPYTSLIQLKNGGQVHK